MKPDRSRPFAPPDLSGRYGGSIVAAIKAFEKGEARADQQVMAMNFIIETLAGVYDEPFRPDEKGGVRETAYALGRAYVGRQLRRIITQPFDALVGTKAEPKPS